jgi:hypothetical protein
MGSTQRFRTNVICIRGSDGAGNGTKHGSWFAAGVRLCYILDMRLWMRDRMRRRSKRGPNTSESTGKIGQELPSNQLAPLQPSYHGGAPAPAGEEVEPETEGLTDKPETAAAEPATKPSAKPESRAAAPKLVVETQPESVATPPPEAPATASGKGARG